MSAVASTAPLRAAIYIRVSDPKQEQGTSLDTQEVSCSAYCQARGYQVVGVYRDVLTAKMLWEREALTRLRHEMPHNVFDVIVIHVLDRLSRQQHHQGLILSEAEHAGIRVESATEDLDNSPSGKFLRGALAFTAELEREKIRERVMRSQVKRAQDGTPLAGARVLYGYQWADADRRAFIPKEPEATIVRRIFADVAASTPLFRLAATLTSEGIPTPTGRARWATSTLYSILTHPGYIGHVTALRYQIEDRDVRDPFTGYVTTKHHTTLRDAQDLAALALPRLAIPPLVTREFAEAVRTRMAHNRAESTRSATDPITTLLRAGFAKCGQCGGNMTVRRMNGRPFYICSARNHRSTECGGHVISAAMLDGAVWARVEQLLTEPEVIAHELERQQDADPTGADLAAVDRRIAEIAKQQATLARHVARLDDEDASTPLLGELSNLATQKRALEQERARLLTSQANWQAARARLHDLQAWCQTVAAQLETLDYETKRLALYALGVRVHVWRKSVDGPRYVIEANVPLEEITAQEGSSFQNRSRARHSSILAASRDTPSVCATSSQLSP